jgi:hypothetical protein
VEIGGSRVASNVTFLLENHPDLAAVATAWPDLPAHVRATIKSIIEATLNK